MTKSLFAAVLLLLSPAALGSGLSKPVNVGPRAIGMGGAFVGVADDPTAIYHNPAGLTQIRGHEFIGGIDTLVSDLQYTAPAFPTEQAKHEFLPVPQFAYATDFLSPLSLGFGLFFPHGNGGKFPLPSAAPLNPDEGRIYSMEIDPAAAWKMFPWLSLGAALRIVRVSSTLKGQLADPATLLVLDDLHLSGWNVGAAAGLLFKPCDHFQLGVNYRSTVKADLKGDVATSAGGSSLGKFDAKLNQTLPTLLTTGVSVKPGKRLTLAGSYGYERNREVTPYTLEVTGLPSLTVEPEWSDSHTMHLGLDFELTDEMNFLAGYARDFNRSIPDVSMNRIVGDIDAHEVSMGFQYYFRRNYVLSFVYNMRFGSRDIPHNLLNPSPGHYEALIPMLSLALGVVL